MLYFMKEVFHMKKFITIIVCCIFFVTGCEKKATMDTFTHITFAQLDEKIASKENMLVYFGWTQNCGDSKNFQDNYLLQYMNDEEKLKEIYVVDLDQENPEGLDDKTKRTDMNEKYGVMYSPTLIYYKEGENIDLLSWTPATTDKETGILQSSLDNFFLKYGYIQKETKK